jgi:SAM-dependent methyltransferase
VNGLALAKRVTDAVGLGGPARRIWRGAMHGAGSAAALWPWVDPWLYRLRVAVEKANYDGVEQVHDLPAIFHYWSNTHLAPRLTALGVGGPEEFFVQEFLRSWTRSTGPKRFVSLGVGNCDAEVRIARGLVDAGRRDFAIDCVDINPTMLQRGVDHARRAGVEPHIVPVEADFNAWTPIVGYDCVMANQALHHVLQLEHLFDAVSTALGDNGRFVIYDIIGRNGHMRWPEAAAVVERFWSELPPPYRYNRLQRRHEEHFLDWDYSVTGFEGIRAQDILPLLIRRFRFELFLGFSNAIDPFVDRAFGHHFDPANPRDTDLIDRIEAEDDRLIRAGTLKPTHMFAIVTQAADSLPLRCLDHLTPAFCVRDPGL